MILYGSILYCFFIFTDIYIYIHCLIVCVWRWMIHNVDRYMDWHLRSGCRGNNYFCVLFGSFSKPAPLKSRIGTENGTSKRFLLFQGFICKFHVGFPRCVGDFPFKPWWNLHWSKHVAAWAWFFWWVRLFCWVIVSFHGDIKVRLLCVQFLKQSSRLVDAVLAQFLFVESKFIRV